MDKFDREGLRAAPKSGNIPVSDGEIRQLDGVLRAIAQRYLARNAAREQDLNGQLTRLEETKIPLHAYGRPKRSYMPSR
jgi:hypothetical protein